MHRLPCLSCLSSIILVCLIIVDKTFEVSGKGEVHMYTKLKIKSIWVTIFSNWTI